MITVTGIARREVRPDGVSWRADAVEVDSEARAASDRCSARLNQLTERLGAVGAVTTEAVSVRPERDEETAIRTGRVEAIGGVRVRADPGRAGELAQAAMDAGADRLDGPHFIYDATDSVREALLGEAVADARREAELLAEAAGRRIARVDAVEEEERYHGVVELASSGDPDVRARDVTVSASVKGSCELHRARYSGLAQTRECRENHRIGGKLARRPWDRAAVRSHGSPTRRR